MGTAVQIHNTGQSILQPGNQLGGQFEDTERTRVQDEPNATLYLETNTIIPIRVLHCELIRPNMFAIDVLFDNDNPM